MPLARRNAHASSVSRPNRKIRLGGGLRLKLLPFAAVQTEAGEALGLDFDYYRIHENLKVNNAPYVTRG